MGASNGVRRRERFRCSGGGGRHGLILAAWRAALLETVFEGVLHLFKALFDIFTLEALGRIEARFAVVRVADGCSMAFALFEAADELGVEFFPAGRRLFAVQTLAVFGVEVVVAAFEAGVDGTAIFIGGAGLGTALPIGLQSLPTGFGLGLFQVLTLVGVHLSLTADETVLSGITAALLPANTLCIVADFVALACPVLTAFLALVVTHLDALEALDIRRTVVGAEAALRV